MSGKKKRDLFAEIVAGFEALRREREIRKLARGIAESDQFSTDAAHADFVTNRLEKPSE